METRNRSAIGAGDVCLLTNQGPAEVIARLKAAGARNATLMRAVLDGFDEARAAMETGAQTLRKIGYGPDGAALGAPPGPNRDIRG